MEKKKRLGVGWDGCVTLMYVIVYHTVSPHLACSNLTSQFLQVKTSWNILPI